MAVTAAVLVLAVPMTGIIAAIAIPNFVNAVQRGKRMRAIADMRATGRAMESYKAKNGCYPQASSCSEAAAALEGGLALKDSWGNDYRCATWQKGPQSSGPDAYAIASAGKEGIWEQEDLRLYSRRETMRFTDDIVYRSGAFIQAPPFESP